MQMDRLTIEPKKGIGIIQLGMTKTEVDECLQVYTDTYEITYKQNPRNFHMKGAIRSCFQLEYDSHGKVTFIQVSSGLKDVLSCVCMDMDVFHTKAEELIAELDKISKYDRDHKELGWTYDFPEWGLSFWRLNICKEEDLQEEWCKRLRPEIQEDEKKYLYFECVSIRCV
jgi:hypothetical protein